MLTGLQCLQGLNSVPFIVLFLFCLFCMSSLSMGVEGLLDLSSILLCSISRGDGMGYGV